MSNWFHEWRMRRKIKRILKENEKHPWQCIDFRDYFSKPAASPDSIFQLYDSSKGECEEHAATQASGSLTHADLMQFAEELKHESHEPPMEILSPNEWKKRSQEAWRRLAYE